MRLGRLELTAFRNLEDSTLSFSPGVNIFFGENGQGKSNLLESICLLGRLRSFRTSSLGELVRWEAPRARVKGLWVLPDQDLEVEIELGGPQRKVLLNGKRPKSGVDLTRDLKLVVFSPLDLSLVQGSPRHRRDWLDTAISNLYPRYADLFGEYERVVQHKNRLLADPPVSPEALDVWQDRLVDLGCRLIELRRRFIDRAGDYFRETFARVFSPDLQASLGYLCSLGPPPEGTEALRPWFREALDRRLPEELRRGQSVVGPHRDDLSIHLEGREASATASQGQTRVLSLSLKVLEIRMISDLIGAAPVVLLDDVFSELDELRTRFLVDFLTDLRCQTFLTTPMKRSVGMVSAKSSGHSTSELKDSRNPECDWLTILQLVKSSGANIAVATR
jgi:DNA replication and repair protein RecF